MRENVVQGMGDAVLEQPTVFLVVVRWQEWSRVSLSPRPSQLSRRDLLLSSQQQNQKFRLSLVCVLCNRLASENVCPCVTLVHAGRELVSSHSAATIGSAFAIGMGIAYLDCGCRRGRVYGGSWCGRCWETVGSLIVVVNPGQVCL